MGLLIFTTYDILLSFNQFKNLSIDYIIYNDSLHVYELESSYNAIKALPNNQMSVGFLTIYSNVL